MFVVHGSSRQCWRTHSKAYSHLMFHDVLVSVLDSDGLRFGLVFLWYTCGCVSLFMKVGGMVVSELFYMFYYCTVLEVHDSAVG